MRLAAWSAGGCHRGTSNDCFAQLLKLQPQSTLWATTHEGWWIAAADPAYDAAVQAARNRNRV